MLNIQSTQQRVNYKLSPHLKEGDCSCLYFYVSDYALHHTQHLIKHILERVDYKDKCYICILYFLWERSIQGLELQLKLVTY